MLSIASLQEEVEWFYPDIESGAEARLYYYGLYNEGGIVGARHFFSIRDRYKLISEYDIDAQLFCSVVQNANIYYFYRPNGTFFSLSALDIRERLSEGAWPERSPREALKQKAIEVIRSQVEREEGMVMSIRADHCAKRVCCVTAILIFAGIYISAAFTRHW